MPKTDYRAMAHAAAGEGNEHLVDTVAKALHFNESIHAHNIADGGYEKPYTKLKTCRYCLLRAGRAVSALAAMGALIVHDAPEPDAPEPQPRHHDAPQACTCLHFVRSHNENGCVYCGCEKKKASFPVTVAPGTRVGWALWQDTGELIASGPGEDGEEDGFAAMGYPDPYQDMIIDELDEMTDKALTQAARRGDTATALLDFGGRDFFYTQVVPR